MTIQSQGPEQDALGSAIGAWNTVKTVHGSIQPLGGREYLAAQQFNVDLSHRIRMRYLPGITPRMRILFQSRVFDIDHVIDTDEKHRELEIFATERL